jgi:hypothetical protein
MQGVDVGEHTVFLYDSWLITRSPILKHIYCESHRYEPWAIRGDDDPVGAYPFPGVLYVDALGRRALLAEIRSGLLWSPRFFYDVERRFRHKGRELLGLAHRARRGERSVALLEALVRAAGQALSIGALKEVLEPDDVVKLLARFVPLHVARAHVLDLFQPLCMPHFVKVEHAVLCFAERYARSKTNAARRGIVRRAIERSAHHARFLLEPTELADRRAMRTRLASEGKNADAIRARRRALLRRHRRARARSLLAQHSILRAAIEVGPASLHARHTLMALIRMAQLIATWEELKHILCMIAAREIRRMLDDAQLPHDATLDELRGALSHA